MYIINGKEYKEKKFDFGALAKLEECGVNLEDFEKMKKPITLVIGLVAWVTDTDKEEATELVNQHVENGGKLSDLVSILETLKTSDFFKKAMKQN